MKLIRVAYGKKDVPKDKREYQLNGVGPVGTVKEFERTFPNETFVIIDRTQPLRKDEALVKGKVKRACKYCHQIHTNSPFTDCHNPAEKLPDSLQDGYRSKGFDDGDDE